MRLKNVLSTRKRSSSTTELTVTRQSPCHPINSDLKAVGCITGYGESKAKLHMITSSAWCLYNLWAAARWRGTSKMLVYHLTSTPFAKKSVLEKEVSAGLSI